MVRDHGLAITLFQPFRDVEVMPEPHRARSFERVRRKFDIMGELGIDLTLMCFNVSPLSLSGISRAASDFLQLGERAAAYSVRAGYNRWARHINDHRPAWEIVRRINHANIVLEKLLQVHHACLAGQGISPLQQISR